VIGIVEMNKQSELTPISLPGYLDMRRLLDGFNSRLLQDLHCFVGDNGRPFYFLSERPFSSSLVVRCVLMTGLDDNVAIDDI
jgi:hypothetical protein